MSEPTCSAPACQRVATRRVELWPDDEVINELGDAAEESGVPFDEVYQEVFGEKWYCDLHGEDAYFKGIEDGHGASNFALVRKE